MLKLIMGIFLSMSWGLLAQDDDQMPLLNEENQNMQYASNILILSADDWEITFPRVYLLQNIHRFSDSLQRVINAHHQIFLPYFKDTVVEILGLIWQICETGSAYYPSEVHNKKDLSVYAEVINFFIQDAPGFKSILQIPEHKTSDQVIFTCKKKTFICCLGAMPQGDGSLFRKKFMKKIMKREEIELPSLPAALIIMRILRNDSEISEAIDYKTFSQVSNFILVNIPAYREFLQNIPFTGSDL